MKKHSVVEWVIQAEEKWGSLANTPYDDPLLIKCRAYLATNRRNEEQFENLPWDRIQEELDSGTPKRVITDLYELGKNDIPRAVKSHIVSDAKWKQERNKISKRKNKEKLNREAESVGL